LGLRGNSATRKILGSVLNGATGPKEKLWMVEGKRFAYAWLLILRGVKNGKQGAEQEREGFRPERGRQGNAVENGMQKFRYHVTGKKDERRIIQKRSLINGHI